MTDRPRTPDHRRDMCHAMRTKRSVAVIAIAAVAAWRLSVRRRPVWGNRWGEPDPAVLYPDQSMRRRSSACSAGLAVSASARRSASLAASVSPRARSSSARVAWSRW